MPSNPRPLSLSGTAAHEIEHLAGDAVATYVLAGPDAYNSAIVHLSVDGPGDGECAVEMPGVDFAVQQQIAAIGAAGPLCKRAGAAALCRAADGRLLAAGLSEPDIAILRKWKGGDAKREQLVAAVAALLAAIPMRKLIDVVLSPDFAATPTMKLNRIIPMKLVKQAVGRANV